MIVTTYSHTSYSAAYAPPHQTLLRLFSDRSHNATAGYKRRIIRLPGISAMRGTQIQNVHVDISISPIGALELHSGNPNVWMTAIDKLFVNEKFVKVK